MNWVTISKYVDIETGEEFTKEKYTKLYYTVKRDKHVAINKTNTIGTITYTNVGRRRPIQGKFI